MVGLNSTGIVSMENITAVVNMTSGDPTEFFINVNQIIYGGWYWFIILIVLWFILYMASQEVKDQALINFMYAGSIVTVLSFLFRAINVLHNGVVWGMLSDSQMWVFPLVTIFSAVIVYNSKSAYQ